MKYAVVVGLGQMYGENLGGDNDARLMAQILKRRGFDVNLFANRKATMKNVTGAIEWMQAVDSPDSTDVFFFSGHGGREAVRLWDGVLHGWRMKGLFAPLQSRKILICIQACYSGSMIDDLEGDGRIVISSATDHNPSVDGRHYSLWGYKFLIPLKKGSTVQEAYNQCGLGMMSDRYGEPMVL